MRAVPSRSALLVAVALISGALALAGCGGGSSSHTAATAASTSTASSTTTASSTATASGTASAPAPKPPPPPPLYPHLLSAALGSAGAGLTPVVMWRGQPAVWLARQGSGIAVLAFDQRLLALHLHSGTTDAGTGYRYGPAVVGLERKRIVAAFNGGFRLNVGAGGFESFGRVGAPLRDGLGSVVTYTDGSTDIGSWHHEVPAPGKTVASVRQNLSLLIDHGAAASTLDCRICWGATLRGVVDPARAALGITADGRLLWAGGEHLTVPQLADALLAAHVMRAVELDINPEWVAGYFYGHRGGHGPLAPVPVMPGQQGIPGEFLAPWSRDFFTIVGK